MNLLLPILSKTINPFQKGKIKNSRKGAQSAYYLSAIPLLKVNAMLSDCYWAGKKVFFCKADAIFVACRKKMPTRMRPMRQKLRGQHYQKAIARSCRSERSQYREKSRTMSPREDEKTWSFIA